jgi:hypothetical protein
MMVEIEIDGRVVVCGVLRCEAIVIYSQKTQVKSRKLVSHIQTRLCVKLRSLTMFIISQLFMNKVDAINCNLPSIHLQFNSLTISSTMDAIKMSFVIHFVPSEP